MKKAYVLFTILIAILFAAPVAAQTYGYQTLTVCAGNIVYISSGSGSLVRNADLPTAPGGTVYASSGVYTDVLTGRGVGGVDSILESTLTFLPTLTGSQTLTVCTGNIVFISSGSGTVVQSNSLPTAPVIAASGTVIYSSAGTYTTTIKNSRGCDSTLTTTVIYTPALTGSTSLSVCPGNIVYVSTASGTVVQSSSLPTAPGGTVYSTAGTYNTTIKNSRGCDSIYTLNITYTPILTGSQTLSVCTGSIVYISTGSGTVIQSNTRPTAPGGVIYSTAGTYTTTIKNSRGCDSSLTTTVSFLPPLTGSLSLNVCVGNIVYVSTGSGTIVQSNSLPTAPGGTTYSSNGSYTTTIQNARGCDSTYTLNITYNPVLTGSQTLNVCPGSIVYISTGSGTVIQSNTRPTAPGGVTYSAAGTYTTTIKNRAGCDSVLTTTVNYIPVLTGSQSLTICSGNIVYISTGSGTVIQANTRPTAPGGVTYTASGTYTTTIQNAAGCDSVLTTNLTVTPPLVGSSTYDVCTGNVLYVSTGSGAVVVPAAGPFAPGGTIYSTSTTATSNVHNAAGCDSTFTFTVNFLPALTGSQSLTICSGNIVYISTASGTVVRAGSGAILPPGGVTYSTSGTYTTTIKNSAGCDSILTTNLTVTPPLTSTATYNICPGNVLYVSTGSGAVVVPATGPFAPGGTIYNTASTNTFNLLNAAGCDSSYTFTINYLPTLTGSQTLSVCTDRVVYIRTGSGTIIMSPSDVMRSGGFVHTGAGTYTDVIQNAAGCDSSLTTTIIDIPASSATNTANVCGTDVYVVSRTAGVSIVASPGPSPSSTVHVHTSSGTYIDTLTNSVGCDSILTSVITVYPLTINRIDTTVCPGGTFNFEGTILSGTGVYTSHHSDSHGCDSTYLVNFTVDSSSFISTRFADFTACDSTSTFLRDVIKPAAPTVCDAYRYQSISGALHTAPSGVTVNTVSGLSDDNVVGTFPIGFSFNFMCNNYTRAYIGSNGFITFNASSGSGCCSGGSIPGSTNPSNLIALFWTDLYPPGGGSVTYWTSGTAPNREFVVQYSNINYCCTSGGATVTGQIVLYENGSTVDLLVDHVTGTGRIISQGVLNNGGFIGVTTPGRNASVWTSTGDGSRFIKTHSATVSWSPTTGLSNPAIIAPLLTTSTSGSWSVTVSSDRCTYLDTINVTINNSTRFTQNDTICPGSRFTVGTHSYSTPGTYVDHFSNSVGCDSMVTTNLYNWPLSSVTTSASICAGDTLRIGSRVITTFGTYVDRLTDIHGCDSTVTTNVTVIPAARGYSTVTIPFASSYIIGSDTIYSSGVRTYTYRRAASSGCDSIYQLTVVVLPSLVSNDIACSSIWLPVRMHYADWMDPRQNDKTNPNCDTLIVSMNGATFSHDEPTPSCAGGTPQRTLWYSFKAPSCAATSIRVSTNASPTNFDTKLAVYDRVTGGCASSTELACSDDVGSGPLPSSSSITLTPGSGAPGSGTYVPGTTYYAQIVDNTTVSGNSVGLVVDVNAPDIALSSPTATSMIVTLPAPSSLSGSGYTGALLRYRVAGTTGYFQRTLSATTSTTTLTGLVPATTYDVWVVYNCASDYWYSARQVLATLPACVPGLPTSITSPPTISNVVGHCRQITASWAPVTGATSYRIYWQVPGSTRMSYDNVTGTTWTSPANYFYVGTTYNFWIQARCSAGSVLQTRNGPTVAFTTCSGAARYAEGEVFSGTIGDVQYVEMSMQDLSQAIQDESNDGQIHTINVSGNGFTQSAAPSAEMLVFPNPAQDVVNVSFKLANSEEKVSLEIIDNNGKVVLTQAMPMQDNMEGEFHLNIGNLPSGMYFVKLVGGNFVKVDKLTIVQP